LFSFSPLFTVRKKGTKAVTGAVPFQKGTLLYLKGAYWYHNCTNMYHKGTNMHPLGTKVYLLKRYRPSDRFRTFFSDSELESNLGQGKKNF